MNPGYAGRTELPESVKALFRPVTCIMPDLELICLISLFSDGFMRAKTLAKKMTVLYRLAREQLSKQYHYDWGLRSLNAVLRMAGVNKRKSPDISETATLMRTLFDMNFPKFVFDDVPLFMGLMKVTSDTGKLIYDRFNNTIPLSTSVRTGSFPRGGLSTCRIPGVHQRGGVGPRSRRLHRHAETGESILSYTPTHSQTHRHKLITNHVPKRTTTTTR